MEIKQEPAGYIWLDGPLAILGFQDHDYCSVSVTADDGTAVIGHGRARRAPDDKHRPEIAQQLALGRALVDSGNKILRRADGLVRHQDYVKAEKQRIKELLEKQVPPSAAPKRRIRKAK